MSLTKNQKLRFWKEVEYSVRSKSLRMRGIVLSSDDSFRVANAYVLWALVIQDLLGDARIHSDSSLSSWVKFLFSQDVSDVVNICKLLLTCIRNWSPYMGCQGLDSFKRYLVDSSILPGDKLLSPLWYDIYQFATTYQNFKNLNSCLSFISRLTLEDVNWILLENTKKYCDFEDSIKLQSYPSSILLELRNIYLSKVKHFSVEKSRPRHGNGATSETKKGAGVSEKFENFQDTFGTRQIALMTGWDHPLIKGDPVSGNDQHARITFVPKGIDKKRVISTEPISFQYYQHLIADGMDKMFCHDRSWNIDLHDQSFNRDLALKGSGHNGFATIDLSDASDSVTRTLVTGIMHDTPLYSLLERCRSRSGILPDRSIIPFEKYAPMGSAICFPLECMIFSLIVQLASNHCNIHPYFRVYGDDIVVPDSIYSEVIMLLDVLHFNINVDKTFPPYSIFTESCGIECYNNEDVSPIRIPRFYDALYIAHLDTSPGRVFGITTFANRLYEFSCFNARSYIISILLDFVPTIPFSLNTEKGLFSPQPTNFHLKSRWNGALQRKEFLCCTLSVVDDSTDDYSRLILVLERLDTTTRLSLSYPSDLMEVMVGSTHLRLKNRWRAQWDLDSIDDTYPKG